MDITNLTDHHPDELTLDFKGHPIRIVMDGQIPLFSLNDVCLAMSEGQWAAELAFGPQFPEHARRICLEETKDGEWADATLLTPIGVWELTTLVDGWKHQQLAAWARREAKRLCPDPQPGDPRIFLTLRPDTEMPPYPTKYSGRRAEFYELKTSCETIMTRVNRYNIVRDLREREAAKVTVTPLAVAA